MGEENKNLFHSSCPPSPDSRTLPPPTSMEGASLKLINAESPNHFESPHRM